MPFEKGSSGNPEGRPIGSSNKATADLREWISNFIDENRDQIRKDWKTLDPKDRIILFEKLLKYNLPTLQSIKNENYKQKEIKLRIIRVTDPDA